MGEMIFTLKCFVYAVVFLFVLQIEIGGRSLDDRMTSFASNSPVASMIGEASQGGARLIQSGYRQIKSWLKQQFASVGSSWSKPDISFGSAEIASSSRSDKVKPKRYLDEPSEEVLEYEP